VFVFRSWLYHFLAGAGGDVYHLPIWHPGVCSLSAIFFGGLVVVFLVGRAPASPNVTQRPPPIPRTHVPHTPRLVMGFVIWCFFLG